MKDEDRDRILSDIQVNSAVTREKVESMDSTMQEVQATLDDHEERLQDVESNTKRNSYVLGGAASTVGASVAALVAKLHKLF